MPKSAVFYSSNRGWPWGAPDYVWPGVATDFLRKSIPVVVVTHPDNLHRPEILSLQAKGALCLAQPPLQIPGGRLEKWRRWRHKQQPDLKKLHRAIQSLPHPHFFINQGGDFDFVDETELLPYLDRNDSSYDIIIRSTRHAPSLSESRRHQIRNYFQKANRVCFNSEWSRDIVQIKLLKEFKNTFVFSHPIKCGVEYLAWPDDEIARLACVNRLDVHHKGLDALLQAVAQLTHTPTSWTLDIYGDGPDRNYLNDMIKWFGLEERIRLQPFENDVLKIWKTHHLLILVSRYEGFGVSMLEAMACGRPVLRTPYGGASEWIQSQQNGFICPAPEPDLIQNTLTQALEIFPQWESIGKAAHTTITEQQPSPPQKLFTDPFQHLEIPL